MITRVSVEFKQGVKVLKKGVSTLEKLESALCKIMCEEKALIYRESLQNGNTLSGIVVDSERRIKLTVKPLHN
ncbi:hypothetical protein NVP1101O_208 [Vibrio phage 1.101.O._10N.261.45.C6]|nr:hypothetical protein NVP1084O_231 [Vibrio phage 1.084.O._10N.261.49.F5]AUR87619.1 hypothetical protein NVP1101O_208 [Vibrio phage 1.101.O._10N.261.45.C6]